MDQSETADPDPRVVMRILTLSVDPLPPGASAWDIALWVSSSTKARREGRSPQTRLRQMLDSSAECRSPAEAVLVESAERCVDGDEAHAARRREYLLEARAWYDTRRTALEEAFIIAANEVLRDNPVATSTLTDGELRQVQRLIKSFAKRVGGEVAVALHHSVDIDASGLDAESVIDAIVGSCEPRDTVDDFLRMVSVSTQGRLECRPQKLIDRFSSSFDALGHLADKLLEVASARRDLAQLAKEEVVAYSELLAAYERDRWDNATRAESQRPPL